MVLSNLINKLINESTISCLVAHGQEGAHSGPRARMSALHAKIVLLYDVGSPYPYLGNFGWKPRSFSFLRTSSLTCSTLEAKTKLKICSSERSGIAFIGDPRNIKNNNTGDVSMFRKVNFRSTNEISIRICIQRAHC